uniref:Uncharacterized protein n=1 Tax=Anguilla anguilla TaxID=7936 RepID=A0A0E9XVU3_ANGAN
MARRRKKTTSRAGNSRMLKCHSNLVPVSPLVRAHALTTHPSTSEPSPHLSELHIVLPFHWT